MRYLYHVDVAPGIHYDCVADEKLKLKPGDEVIIACERYQDFGVINRVEDDKPVDDKMLRERVARSRGRRVQGRKVPSVLRRSNIHDKSRIHENEVRAKSMFKTAHQKVSEHGLPMKLVNAHFSFDKKLLILQFTADGRVDFRELVRDLSRTLHTRVELRQIGVRDEAAIQGGIGCCGRPFCCASFLRQFVSINVKMAKEQGLSLNPSTISGACGRLKCCLRYENKGYRELRRHLPRRGSICETEEGRGRILDANALTQTVRVRLEDSAGKVVVLPVDEVDVKSRRGRKNRSGGSRGESVQKSSPSSASADG